MSLGHAQAWDYTPIQLHGYIFLARRRQKRLMRDSLAIAASAMRSSPQDLKAQLQSLEDRSG